MRAAWKASSPGNSQHTTQQTNLRLTPRTLSVFYPSIHSHFFSVFTTALCVAAHPSLCLCRVSLRLVLVLLWSSEPSQSQSWVWDRFVIGSEIIAHRVSTPAFLSLSLCVISQTMQMFLSRLSELNINDPVSSGTPFLQRSIFFLWVGWWRLKYRRVSHHSKSNLYKNPEVNFHCQT